MSKEARNQLAEVLWGHHYETYSMNPDGTERSYCQCGAAVYPLKSLVQHQAECALAAGYRKPRIIRTVEELDALVDGSAVLDDDGDISTKHAGRWHGYEMAPLASPKFSHCGPFTVLHEPAPRP